MGSARTSCLDMNELDGSTINVAGIVARCLDDTPDEYASQIIEFWQNNNMSPSPTDLEGILESWEAGEVVVKTENPPSIVVRCYSDAAPRQIDMGADESLGEARERGFRDYPPTSVQDG